jgi:hypothetical protein
LLSGAVAVPANPATVYIRFSRQPVRVIEHRSG